MVLDVRQIFDDVRAQMLAGDNGKDSTLLSDTFVALQDLAEYMERCGYPIDKVVANPEKKILRIMLKAKDVMDMKALTFTFDEWQPGHLSVKLGFMDVGKRYDLGNFNITEDAFDDDMVKATRAISKLTLQSFSVHCPDDTPSL